MKKLITTTVLISAISTGCATVPSGRGGDVTYAPIIDTQNLPEGRNYSKDLRECNRHAAQIKGAGKNAFDSGVVGAGLGAAIGAAIGAAFGADVGQNAALGAASGGISGAAGGAVNSARTKRLVIKRCMSHRGYSVLN